MVPNHLLFSIIVPTYSRPGQLAMCLGALSRLDYPRDRFEVIVVDDGSKVPPDKVIVACDDALSVTLLLQPNRGPASARNTGAANAKGRFLAFTDDDCEPAADWLKKLEVRFSTSPDCAISGRKTNALTANLYSTASQMLTDLVYSYFNANAEQASFISTSNLALPADAFHEIGGFNPAFRTAEDRELCDRWRHHGRRVIFAPEVLVYHSHRLTLSSYLRQHFNFGRGASRFHRTRAQRQSGRLKPDLRFYLRVVRHPFSAKREPPAVLFALLLIAAQGANAAGFFWEGLRRKGDHLDG